MINLTPTMHDVVLYKPVYKNLSTPVLMAKADETNPPTLAAFKTGVSQYTLDVTNDKVYGAFVLPYEYAEGGDLPIYIKWASNGSEKTDAHVAWELKYSIQAADGTFGAVATVDEEAKIVKNTVDRTYYATLLGTVTGTGLKIGAQVMWTLARKATEGDAPAADPFALSVDFLCPVNTMGSRYALAK